ncbi:MAG TPA: methyltransferase domain-containing protein [Aquifex aeolicus]|uniref:Methyltransferase domain-containing protein n=1 Tax=Aquifex aeolicus TaxID=63363 RepID=A0A7C5QLM7_AQUAO|nr:methyltransferase domain-containing protein [Aquifex aeolicus]
MGYRTVADIFSQISGTYDFFLKVATAGRIHSWQRELVSLMNPGGNWLDVGTGTGEVLLKLGENYEGLRVGVDPSLEMLRIADQKCGSCFFVQGIGEALPFRNGSFSNVSLSLVFRHLEDKMAFLSEANRLLAENGRLGLIDIGRFRGTFLLLLLMKTLLRPLGVLLFGRDRWSFFIHSVEESYSIEEIENMLRLRGFRIQEVRKRFLGVVYIVVAVRTASGT